MSTTETQAQQPSDILSSIKQIAFFVNTDTCVGCGTCEIACKDQNNLTVGPRPRFVRNMTGGNWTRDGHIVKQEGVFSYSVSVSCNHCKMPVCVTACPTGAMAKDSDTGIVSNDIETCIGCGACAEACPYNAPQLVKEEAKVRKCDFCRSLLEQGLRPACVETCPMRALDFGDLDEIQSKYGKVSDIAPLPDSSETQPSLALKPHRDVESGGVPSHMLSLYRQE